MALHLERVELAKVKPLVDEYGNEFANRDYTLKANKDYVADLAASFGSEGEPEEPVKLVRDGDEFRIKTGNSRVMAMKQLGTTECWALIDDNDTVQSVLEAVIRTDHKKKYEDVELSRYSQQLMMFGDDDYVSSVTGIQLDRVRGIRRASKKASDAAKTMTLDHLLIVDEFEGDDDAQERLLACNDAEKAQSVAATIRKEREQEAEREAFEAAIESAGLPLVEEKGDRYYVRAVHNPGELVAAIEETRETHDDLVGMMKHYSWSGWEVFLFGVPNDKAERGAEESEKQRRQEQAESAYEAALDARESWFMDQIRADADMPAVSALLRDVFLEHKISSDYRAATYDEALDLIADADEGARIDETMNQLCRFIVWWWLPYHNFSSTNARVIAGCGHVPEYMYGQAEAYLELGEAMREDGYEPDEADTFITEMLTAGLTESDDDGE